MTSPDIKCERVETFPKQATPYMKNIDSEHNQRLPELQLCTVSSVETVGLVQVDKPHKVMRTPETRNDVNNQVRTEIKQCSTSIPMVM